MKLINVHISCLLAASLLPVSGVRAQTVHDGFESGTAAGQYPDGADASSVEGGGSNWSQGSWRNTSDRKMTAVAEGLAYSDGTNDLAAVDGAVASPLGDETAELERDFQSYGAGQELWFSVLMDREPAAHGFEDRFAFQLRSQTGDLKYSIRALDGSKSWHVSYVPQGSNGEEIDELPDAAYDEPVFVVGQIKTIGSKQATFSLWVNPKDLKNLGSPSWMSPPFHAQGVGRVTFVADGTRVGKFDEVRIGTTRDEVVPIKQAKP